MRRRKRHDPVAQLASTMPHTVINRAVNKTGLALAFRQGIDKHAVNTIARFFDAGSVASYFPLFHGAGQFRHLLVVTKPAYGSRTLCKIIFAAPAPTRCDVTRDLSGAPDFTAVGGICGPVPGRFGRAVVDRIADWIVLVGCSGHGGNVDCPCQFDCCQECACQKDGAHPAPPSIAACLAVATGRSPNTWFFRIPDRIPHYYHRVHWSLSIVEKR